MLLSMDSMAFLDVMRESVLVLLKISAPILLITLVISVIVSLLQALLQLQEMSITFIPKIIALLLAIFFSMPFMSEQLANYGRLILVKIQSIK